MSSNRFQLSCGDVLVMVATIACSSMRVADLLLETDHEHAPAAVFEDLHRGGVDAGERFRRDDLLRLAHRHVSLGHVEEVIDVREERVDVCLLYPSDAAD